MLFRLRMFQGRIPLSKCQLQCRISLSSVCAPERFSVGRRRRRRKGLLLLLLLLLLALLPPSSSSSFQHIGMPRLPPPGFVSAWRSRRRRLSLLRQEEKACPQLKPTPEERHSYSQVAGEARRGGGESLLLPGNTNMSSSSLLLWYRKTFDFMHCA